MWNRALSLAEVLLYFARPRVSSVDTVWIEEAISTSPYRKLMSANGGTMIQNGECKNQIDHNFNNFEIHQHKLYQWETNKKVTPQAFTVP